MFLKILRFKARMINFQYAFWHAKRREQDIRLLQNIIGVAFLDKHRSFSGTFSGIAPRPGYDRNNTGSICWEAPIAYAVFLDKKPAFGMGIELRGKTLVIRQLQGVSGVSIPVELHAWPRIFVEACMAFAQERNLKCVRLCRADQELFYKEPHVASASEELIQEIRRRMRRRYDGTARQLKFKMEKKWGVWYNPEYKK